MEERKLNFVVSVALPPSLESKVCLNGEVQIDLTELLENLDPFELALRKYAVPQYLKMLAGYGLFDLDFAKEKLELLSENYLREAYRSLITRGIDPEEEYSVMLQILEAYFHLDAPDDFPDFKEFACLALERVFQFGKIIREIRRKRLPDSHYSAGERVAEEFRTGKYQRRFVAAAALLRWSEATGCDPPEDVTNFFLKIKKDLGREPSSKDLEIMKRVWKRGNS